MKREDGKGREVVMWEFCVRKNTYCNTIGCCARAPRLLPPDEAALEDSGMACFSIRAHVR
jgi:hypothetical protein